MIERSQTSSGIGLRLVDFEGHQENLKELHRAYLKAEAVSRDAAEQLKENRIAAIILDVPKTQTRHIRHDFQDKYLEEVLPEEFKPQEPSLESSASVGIPGLRVSAPAVAERVTRARVVTDRILKIKAVEVSENSDGENRQTARKAVVEARKWLGRALDSAERDERLRRVQQTAAERIDDARAAIDQSVSDLVRARASNELDEDGFDQAIVRLRVSLEKLARQVNRGLADPGRGVQWLTKAVTEGQS
jgi:hypothetical protein